MIISAMASQWNDAYDALTEVSIDCSECRNDDRASAVICIHITHTHKHWAYYSLNGSARIISFFELSDIILGSKAEVMKLLVITNKNLKKNGKQLKHRITVRWGRRRWQTKESIRSSCVLMQKAAFLTVDLVSLSILGAEKPRK